MSGVPLIVTADFGNADQAQFDALRRAYYPPQRNQLPAHLTMFHALPPSVELDLRHQLALIVDSAAPRARLSGLINLGGGVAFRIESEELEAIRDELARHFHGCLTAQDAQGWRPHVTVQNKVTSSAARRLIEELERGVTPRPVDISGLSLHRYLGGPWDRLGRYAFRR